MPSCASVAWPEKLMTSPTFQVVPAAGASIVAVGGVLPAVMVTESVPRRAVVVGDAQAAV